MTTKAAEAFYLARHRYEHEGRRWAIYNPENKPTEELPVIYGFNNGGSPGWYSAVLVAADGTCLGGHCCSHEGYMESDLGVLEGSRPDRHETFRTHYPSGYRMEFVGGDSVRTHPGLLEAYRLNQIKAAESQQDSKP
jgi:hypothetical protein